VILPNYGLDSNPDAIRRTVELAEELGFGSVWAAEHISVGPEAVNLSFNDELAMRNFALGHQ
jgi:alkanesulfonate monooxygenase SsuD/methylene tetrahydromethanopterin reductase-like flavin-dependent oxidoreductase (luciferase family)